MLKGKKTFVTPEISSSFCRSLKEVTMFSGSEFVVTADWIGHELRSKDIILHIQDLSPTLVITASPTLAAEIRKFSACKIFLLKDDYEESV